MFQVTKWGWKRIAARLLLVPVLAGGSAAIAPAQMRTAAGGPAPAPAAKGRPPAGPAMAGDPKAMLKEGRKALDEGRFNDAQDLARRAEASNPSGKWGLFDDTPNALLKDVQAAVAKAQKVEADQLVKKAKALFTKSPVSDGERAVNLKAALEMAHRAESLHGPYSVWDLGDRADKLAKEIETARAKLRPVPPPPNGMAGVPGTGQPFAAALPPAETRPSFGQTPARPGGVMPAGGPQAPGGVMPAGG
ncbi:MAG: hypothetical protein JWO38_4299, partial [Gemmataceae bacterium]|nr:hypothetical protein [Gemmataceae bacterium]